MKQYLIITAAVIFLASCSSTTKDKDAVLKEKKEQLEKLKTDKEKTDQQIKDLQAEIIKLDPSADNAQKAKLVTVQAIQAGEFNHFIKLQGRIDAENISYITPRGGGGQIKAIYVKQGQQVKKGQLLMKLDDAVAKQNYTAVQQSLQTLKTQLAYAQNIYQRQQNLWSQNIGTEVQVITAKNNVATLENQLAAAQENAKVVWEQLNTTNVISDVDGVADVVTVKVGEIFGVGGGVIKIVNNSALKVVCTIPENYQANVKNGTSVMVQVPDVNKTINTSLSFVSSTIDPNSRGFNVEAKLPSDPLLRPNQIAEVNIKDYSASSAIVVPVETLQTDLNGKFIMVAVKENGKLIARKRPVTIGSVNDDKLEVLSGLNSGDMLISQGFQGLYDGQVITTQ